MGLIRMNILPGNTKTLSELLADQGIHLEHQCMGKGLCHSCEVVVDDGQTNSRVKACQFTPDYGKSHDITVNYPTSSNLQIKSAGFLSDTISSSLCIDLGTTTIAMSFNGKTSVFTNPQRQYGCDILSRMEASLEGNAANLKKCLLDELILQGKRLTSEKPHSIYLCGNTTMIHLLLGYPCDSLSRFPFKPYSLRQVICEYENIPVYILPCASSFIGGDIISGLYYLRCTQSLPHNYLFLDLGTNGEMVLSYNDRLVASSTAAGPALEGGNLSCGIASVPGAIYSCHITGSRLVTRTIDDRAPIGLCGTGALSLLAELRRHNIVDQTGLLDEAYQATGYPIATTPSGDKLFMTLKDIRNLQLAIAAISAGIMTLLSHCHASASDIDYVYIAGGLGYQLNMEDAFTLGLFPHAWKNKVMAVGNTSLGGLVCLAANNVTDPIHELPMDMENLYLADHAVFREFFIHKMEFPDTLI